MSKKIICLLCIALTGLSCKIVDTSDSETNGRGDRAFDPYQANNSGAIRLSLQSYNGCAITPDLRVAGKGNSNIPYPSCKYVAVPQLGHFVENASLPEPTEPLLLMAGTHYFLNQITLINSAFNQETDPTRLDQVAQWFQSIAPFNKLDWTGLGITGDEWNPSEAAVSPYSFERDVRWGNANWMKKTDDTFTVDVLDADGTVRSSATYAKSDFLVQNPATHHTMLEWVLDAVAPPAFPGDNSVNPAAKAPPGFPPNLPPFTHSIFKIELEVQVHPNNQVEIPAQLTGDGAIRITWSQLPNDPFYFPVRFVPQAQVPPTCYSGANGTDPVPCSFGVVPIATFSKPRNGKFYVPGETVQVNLAVKDSDGNFINAKDHFPSWSDYINGKSNGLIYFNNISFTDLNDYDVMSGWEVAGPKQAMRPMYQLNGTAYYRSPTDQMIPGNGNAALQNLAGPTAALNVIPGAQSAKVPTTWSFTLPADAKPGTYTLYWKVNRYFMGERFTKLQPFDFQVGQAEETQFPGRVGNCQICHRGTLSFENVRHGLSVNYVEGCKACHVRDAFAGGRGYPTQRLFHRIHMTSYKFPLPKNQCTVCHLTRESALRPSYEVCAACHNEPHAATFGKLETTTDFDPKISDTVYSDCGSTCHANTPPTQHILPVQ